MPTVFRTGPYRFFFYAGDRHEPLHVQVERGNSLAKFWLDPIRLQHNSRFNRPEILRIQRMLAEHYSPLVEAWNAYFGS
jgi:Domain of unknown function (DUF4160)